jgi:predicted 3-demethylubiquinone-9 3-methyltransferase (glyoxalase superfamily)
VHKVTPFLWFDQQAQDAARFYVSVFKDGKVGKPVAGPDGKVMVVPFEIQGQEFTALNGGPQFKFNESVSFVVHCKDQEEVDYYWNRLVEGGEESQCGWLKDRFGLSWQIVPTRLNELTSDPDPARATAATKAMLGMRKIIIAELEDAVRGV